MRPDRSIHGRRRRHAHRSKVEQLERRTLLAVKIPVFNFHRVLPDSVPGGSGSINETNFTAVLNALGDYDPLRSNEPPFHSITLKQYYNWRTDPTHPTTGMPDQPWFIAIFDDSKIEEL